MHEHNIYGNIQGRRIESMKEKVYPTTFLDIAGISHDENSWSDIYAYFLREPESGHLFLNALLHLITLKTHKELSFADFIVERETATNKQNKIDLLITSTTHSIIIENKVHHILNNDLEDYWLSTKGQDSEKTGVVLTLSCIPVNHPDFVNITHEEWIIEVQKRLNDKQYHLSSQKELIFKDFYQCIMKETKNIDTEISKSYLENREWINNLVDIASETKDWLKRIFTDKQFIHNNLKNFTLVHEDKNNSQHRYAMYKLPGTDELVITILYEFLWNSKPEDARLLFLIEPLGNWFKKAKKIDGEIIDIVKKEGIGYNYHRDKRFWHCGGVECKFTEEQILDKGYIQNCIIEHLVNPESKLMKAARRIAEKLSSTHLPSYSWDDVLQNLKKTSAELPEEDYSNWVVGNCEFLFYDRMNQVVVLEVGDEKAKAQIEKSACRNYLMPALKYAFGESVRCSIICRHLDKNE